MHLRGTLVGLGIMVAGLGAAPASFAVAGSCAGLCGFGSPNPPSCYCDAFCSQYGDCCADFKPLCLTTWSTDGVSCQMFQPSGGGETDVNPTNYVFYDHKGACNMYEPNLTGGNSVRHAIVSCPISRGSYKGANGDGTGFAQSDAHIYVEDQNPALQVKCEINARTATGSYYYSTIKYSCSQPNGCNANYGTGVYRPPMPEAEASFVGAMKIAWTAYESMAGGGRMDQEVVNVIYYCEIPQKTAWDAQPSCIRGGNSHVVP